MHDIDHKHIARRYWPQISGTFFLLLCENFVDLVTPYLLGQAINKLLDRDLDGLFVFLLVSLAGLIIGVLRRLYDTRAYGRIYRDLGEQVAAKEDMRQATVSRTVARAGLIKDVVDFFEIHLPMSFSSVSGLIGAGIMLVILSPGLGIAVFAVSGLVWLIFILSKSRIRSLNAALNDELEQQVAIFEKRQVAVRQRHFANLVGWRIRLSDLEARNFGLVEFLLILLSLFALYETVWVQQLATGDVFAVLTYVIQFSQGLILLPYMYQEFIRTEEITARINAEE